MKLAVIIPAYNEEDTIESVIDAVPHKIDRISAIRIFVIDNGSKDKTPQIAQKKGAELVTLKYPSLAKAFIAGIYTALVWDAQIIVNLDADGQYRAEEIPNLIRPILDGEADMVIGDRQVAKLKHMPFTKKYGNLLGSRFIRFLTGLTASDPQATSYGEPQKSLQKPSAASRAKTIDASSGFRAFSPRAAEQFKINSTHTYTHENLIQAASLGLRIAQIPVSFLPRPPMKKAAAENANRSKPNPSRLISSVPVHIAKSLMDIFKAWRRYKKK